MKNGSAILLAMVLVAVAATIWYRFDQYVIQRNFVMVANAFCDPESEECFVMDCDPETDEECDATPYKKVSILASEAPACLQEHTCETFSCDGLSSCEITTCDDESLEEGEACYVHEEPAQAEDTTETPSEAAEPEETNDQ